MSNNHVESLLQSGLHLCTHLRVLLAANNKLADGRHVQFLALLPSLQVLDVKGNPFAQPPTSRYGDVTLRFLPCPTPA